MAALKWNSGAILMWLNESMCFDTAQCGLSASTNPLRLFFWEFFVIDGTGTKEGPLLERGQDIMIGECQVG